MRRNNPFIKTISVVVMMFFLINDIVWALSAGLPSGDLGTLGGQQARNRITNTAEQKYVAVYGESPIDFLRFKGKAPAMEGIEAVPAGYGNLPDDLIKALSMRFPGYAIREEAFEWSMGYGAGLPIYAGKTDDKVIRIHTKFVKFWNHIKKNDLSYKETVRGSDDKSRTRTVSVASELFDHVVNKIFKGIRRHIIPPQVLNINLLV